MAYEYERELREKIAAKTKELEQMQQIAKSMLAGYGIERKFSKSDYDSFLSFYREEVEVARLMRLYNEWFPGSELEEIGNDMHKRIEKIEDIITDLMSKEKEIR